MPNKTTNASIEVKLDSNGFLTYKGKPLVRSKDTLYYGDMSDSYVAMLEILEKKTENGVDLATKVGIKVINTDITVPPTKMVFKSGEQKSLYEALDIAEIWLGRALKQGSET